MVLKDKINKKEAKRIFSLCCDKLIRFFSSIAEIAVVAVAYVLCALNRPVPKRLSGNARRTVIYGVALPVIFAGVIAVAFMSFTASVKVSCNGVDVGFVESESDADEVEEIVKSTVYGDTYGVLKFSIDKTVVATGKLSDSEAVAERVLENVDGIEQISGLFVDGNLTVAARTDEELSDMLDLLAKQYSGEGMTFAGYANSIKAQRIYAVSDRAQALLCSADDFCSGISGVKVKYTRIESYTEEIPYEVFATSDVSKTKGYTRVISAGKNGLMLVTADVTYVNGVRSISERISSEVLTEPVTERVAAGISDVMLAKVSQSFSSLGITDGESMIFPCKITDSTYISAYWGDGRGHKGVDIASPYGTDIYVAAPGTVTFAGYKGDYGYLIEIDHGDGRTQTLYSHCSKITVKKGETVTAGQVIGKVGATGNASGNHLHFAVIKDGTMVDPAPYIGITK